MGATVMDIVLRVYQICLDDAAEALLTKAMDWIIKEEERQKQ